MGPPYGPSCILSLCGADVCLCFGWLCLPCIHVCLYISLTKWELSHIMTIEHYSLGGCAAWSADACTFLICFRLLSCVYTYVMSTWAMPWAGTLSRIWRNSPRGWLVPMFMWVGFIHCPCPVGWPDSALFTFTLSFFSVLLFLLTNVFICTFLLMGIRATNAV